MILNDALRTWLGASLMVGLASLTTAMAEEKPTPSGPVLSSGQMFSEQTGEGLFANVCQGCHMRDAGGAAGAGAYPSLIRDGNLAVPGYPVALVLGGARAMPALGWMMSDDQVAAVVNYVRTHFGNAYADTVTAADVKALRR